MEIHGMSHPLLILVHHPMESSLKLDDYQDYWDLESSIKPWKLYKYWQHTRDPIKTGGTFVNSEGDEEVNTLYFWGEWEAESEIEIVDNKTWLTPRVSHVSEREWECQYNEDKKRKRHDTDPFVFGDSIYYYDCQQKYLPEDIPEGSILLFGTTDDDHFYFDTVIVVASCVEYSAAGIVTANNPTADKILIEHGIKPHFYWNHSQGTEEKRLFSGRKFQSLDTPFSFFPCRDVPYGHEEKFARNRFPSVPITGEFTEKKVGDTIKVKHRKLQEKDDWNNIITSMKDYCFGIEASLKGAALSSQEEKFSMANKTTILGRVGSSVLLFQTESSTPPYKPVGVVYSLSNLLCFCKTASSALKGNNGQKFSDLVSQANLVQCIEAKDLLFPSIFQIVDNSWLDHTKTLVASIKTGKQTDNKEGANENFLRVTKNNQICCIGNGSVYGKKFQYASICTGGTLDTMDNPSRIFDELFSLVERYLQL